MTTENTAEMTLETLELGTPQSGQKSLALESPFTLPAGRYSPHALCRMCAARLSLKTLERLILVLLLDELECGVARPHSYGELGRALCKCEHSVKAAMSSLRAAGLVTTSRVGFGEGSVSISCDAFLRWAERVLNSGSGVSKTGDSVSKTADPVSRMEESVTTGVPGRTQPRRMRTRTAKLAPAAKKEETPAPCDAASADSASAVFVAVADDDEPVDNSEELADTLKAAGRALGARASGGDDFSFGSDTAETDIGAGVRINPDI